MALASPGVFDYGGASLHRCFVAVLIPLAIVGGIVALIVWAVRSSNERTRGHGLRSPSRRHRPRRPPWPTLCAAAAEPLVRCRQPCPRPADGQRSRMPCQAAPRSPTAPAVTAPPAPSRHGATRLPPYAAAATRSRPGQGGLPAGARAGSPSIARDHGVLSATTDQLAVFPVLVAGVIYVAGLGLILVITALRGRKLGFLGFVSVVALIPVAIAHRFCRPRSASDYASRRLAHWFDTKLAQRSRRQPCPIRPLDPFDPVPRVRGLHKRRDRRHVLSRVGAGSDFDCEWHREPFAR